MDYPCTSGRDDMKFEIRSSGDIVNNSSFLDLGAYLSDIRKSLWPIPKKDYQMLFYMSRVSYKVASILFYLWFSGFSRIIIKIGH